MTCDDAFDYTGYTPGNVAAAKRSEGFGPSCSLCTNTHRQSALTTSLCPRGNCHIKKEKSTSRLRQTTHTNNVTQLIPTEKEPQPRKHNPHNNRQTEINSIQTRFFSWLLVLKETSQHTSVSPSSMTHHTQTTLHVNMGPKTGL